jgi:hypothetical protein
MSPELVAVAGKAARTIRPEDDDEVLDTGLLDQEA